MNLPIPNSFPQEEENQKYSYAYLGHMADGSIPEGRWTAGPSMDGKGEFTAIRSEPMGGVPSLAPARPDGGAQTGQMSKSGAEGLFGRVEGAIERKSKLDEEEPGGFAAWLLDRYRPETDLSNSLMRGLEK